MCMSHWRHICGHTSGRRIPCLRSPPSPYNGSGCNALSPRSPEISSQLAPCPGGFTWRQDLKHKCSFCRDYDRLLSELVIESSSGASVEPCRKINSTRVEVENALGLQDVRHDTPPEVLPEDLPLLSRDSQSTDSDSTLVNTYSCDTGNRTDYPGGMNHEPAIRSGRLTPEIHLDYDSVTIVRRDGPSDHNGFAPIKSTISKRWTSLSRFCQFESIAGFFGKKESAPSMKDGLHSLKSKCSTIDQQARERWNTFVERNESVESDISFVCDTARVMEDQARSGKIRTGLEIWR